MLLLSFFVCLLDVLECAQVSKTWVAFLFYYQRGFIREGRAWPAGAVISELACVSSAGAVTAEHREESVPPEQNVNCAVALSILLMLKPFSQHGG